MIARIRFSSLLLPVALLLSWCSLAHAQVGPEDFHSRVLSLYSFQPHTLTNEQVGAKSIELDAFWAQAKANP